MTLAYDPLGRLAAATTGTGVVTHFLYDGQRLVAEYGATGAALRRYVHGDGVDEPLVWYDGTEKRWLHADRLGSVIAWSGPGGAVTTYAYGPWGEPTDWGALRFRYTGQIALPKAQV